MFQGKLSVGSRETYSDEQYVALLESYLFLLDNLLQMFGLNCSALEGFDLDPVSFGPSCPVKKDSPTNDASFLGPGIYTIDSTAVEIGFRLSVEELLGALIPVVPETIPLRATLCVKMNNIIINRPRRERQQVVVEALSAKEWSDRTIQGPIEGDADAFLHFRCCRSNRVGGDKIQSTELVIFAEKSPSITWRPFLVQREVVEGR